MSILHAIVLGITQGLTEFFPISSSGHLALVPWVFGWDDFGDNETLAKAFDVALHLGTLVGAVAYFRKDLWRYLKGGLAAVFKPADGHFVRFGVARAFRKPSYQETHLHMMVRFPDDSPIISKFAYRKPSRIQPPFRELSIQNNISQNEV